MVVFIYYIMVWYSEVCQIGFENDMVMAARHVQAGPAWLGHMLAC